MALRMPSARTVEQVDSPFRVSRLGDVFMNRPVPIAPATTIRPNEDALWRALGLRAADVINANPLGLPQLFFMPIGVGTDLVPNPGQLIELQGKEGADAPRRMRVHRHPALFRATGVVEALFMRPRGAMALIAVRWTKLR